MKIFYSAERSVWRAWLNEHFASEPEVWFVFPMKEAGEAAMPYNDAVEEALCFGWIDSTIKHIDALHRAQRFTPRKKGSAYSRPNIERLIRLEERGLLHPDVRKEVLSVIREPFVFPEDILDAVQAVPEAWENVQNFPAGYLRIRIAYIDAARKRPAEFQKRLGHFIAVSREGKLIRGFGGIEKYY
ncbi:MAG TPA: YdeI/OmpD-associated family protein [Methanocorpusculum sp.]|nr:YdeI/OmpD-associated family protein [Methanocorpusculum sp.]